MKKDDRSNVLIIGAGAAGAVAAAYLAKLKHKVVLVHKSTGASGFSSGAVDVADGKLNEVPTLADPFLRGESWIKAAQNIKKSSLSHPYSRLDDDSESLVKALNLLVDLAKEVELEKRSDNHNFILATEAGTLKHSALVQRNLCFDWSNLDPGAVIGVVEFSGFWKFKAKPVAERLGWISRMRPNSSLQIVPLTINLDPLVGSWRSSTEIAEAFADENMQANFIKQLKTALVNIPVKPEHLLFPAVLSFYKTANILAKVKDETGISASELLAMPTSVPGIRFSKALFSGLSALDVKCIEGKITNFSMIDKKINTVQIENKNSDLVILNPEIVILATGRVLAGGLFMDGIFKEAIFNLPVWGERSTEANVAGNHELFKMGLALDTSQRPLNQFGELFASNLYAAGSIVRGYDPAKEATGLGVAAMLGYQAAKCASNSSKTP